MWAFRYLDGPFLNAAPSNEFQRERFADCVSRQKRLYILKSSDRFPPERHQNVPDDYSSLVCGAVRMYFQNNRRGLFVLLQRLTKGIRQAHRLQTDSEISARNAPLFQKRVDDFVYAGSWNCNRAETRKARRRQTDYVATRVDYRAAD
jgi:hypothetical protein